MWIPPTCRAGDVVEVVHPAGVYDGDAVRAGVAALERAGFVVRHAAPGAVGYLAGDDEARLASLRRAIVDDDVRAVWCARGGYGSMRLLAELEPDLLRRHPTWLVGYSDITALHAWAARQGVVSLHGPMVQSLGRTDAARDDLRLMLPALAGTAPELAGTLRVVDGEARGPVVGGNLSLVCALLGTPYEVPLDGALLVLEDVGEPPYRVDRMLTQLALTGVPERVAGVVVGQFTRKGEADDDARHVAIRELRRWGVPCAAGFETGHGSPNQAWWHGATATLHVGDGGATLRFDGASAKAARAPEPSPVARWSPRADVGGPLGLLHAAVRDGTCSAAQLEVSRGGEVVLAASVGVTAVTPDATRVAVTPDTRFDIASVTKAVCTGVLAGVALATGALSLDDRIPAELSMHRPTLRDLLRHSSGLPAHVEVFREVRALTAGERRGAAEARFAAIPGGPAGEQVYSDVGYIALGRWLELALGASLPALFDRHVAKPLGLTRTGFGDGASPVAGPCAATEWCPWRDATLQGIVHDENCQVLGGAAGHAGLFSTAHELAAIGRSLIGFGPKTLDASIVATLWNPASKVPGGTYVLGWDTPSGSRSNAGAIAARDATTGHLGFTGTSLWIDRSRDVVVALLTNRVHPTRENPRIRDLRPALHDAVFEHLGLTP